MYNIPGVCAHQRTYRHLIRIPFSHVIPTTFFPDALRTVTTLDVLRRYVNDFVGVDCHKAIQVLEKGLVLADA